MIESPWLNLREAAKYIKRSPRFTASEIKNGRIRAARIGGRGEVLTKAAWLDEYLEELARPVAMPFTAGRRQRA
jgi:excisionase family DNA binding protein